MTKLHILKSSSGPTTYRVDSNLSSQDIQVRQGLLYTQEDIRLLFQVTLLGQGCLVDLEFLCLLLVHESL